METKRLVRIVIFVIVILALFYFLPKGHVEADSGEQILMGTFAHIIAVAGHRDIAQKGTDEAFISLRQIEAIASTHLEDSEISRVNAKAFLEPVKVSDPLFEILQAAVDYGKLTKGAFDITVGPLIEVWQAAADTNSVPEPNQLEEALTKVGYDKIRLDPNNETVRFSVEGMKLDLGGIAKGYAIDRAIDALKQAGAVGGMVDVGGDIRCFGIPAGGKKNWLIGLQDPDLSQKEQNLLVLKLGDAAVATSGDYRRFVLIGGEKHSHIVNTHTGQSAVALSSVSVITEKAVDADALATGVSVLGPEDGLKLIDSLDNTEAIIISPAPDYFITATAGAEKYIMKSHTEVQIYTGQ
jgi:thiamine biosynthesis lipoprotein